MAEPDQQFIEYVVKNLVEHPDEVKIERSVDERGILLQLSVHPDDMGKVIGKAGSTAKAIRTLLRVVGSKNDERLNLKIIDRDGGELPGETHQYAPPASTPDAASTPASNKPSEGNTPTEEPEATLAPTEPSAAKTVDVEAELDAIKSKAREGIEDLDMDI